MVDLRAPLEGFVKPDTQVKDRRFLRELMALKEERSGARSSPAAATSEADLETLLRGEMQTSVLRPVVHSVEGVLQLQLDTLFRRCRSKEQDIIRVSLGEHSR